MAKRRRLPPSSQPVPKKKTKSVEKDVTPEGFDEFRHDEIDQFHEEREKIPLDANFAHQRDDSESEEEVLALESDGSDDDSDDELESDMAANLARLQRNLGNEDMASDIEDPEDGLPDSQAWGKMRHKYYGADVYDEDEPGSDDSDLAVADLEEKEALLIQKRLAEQLDDEDFNLHTFQPTAKLVGDKDEIIVSKDIASLSKREKQELLRKESPEFFDLVEDYKLKLSEAGRLQSIVERIKSGELPQTATTDYLQTKFRIILSYCLNLSFYLMLKVGHEPVTNHPVISRIVQYRRLLKQLEVADDKFDLTELMENTNLNDDDDDDDEDDDDDDDDGDDDNDEDDDDDDDEDDDDVKTKNIRAERKKKESNLKIAESKSKKKRLSTLLDEDEENVEESKSKKKRKVDKSSAGTGSISGDGLKSAREKSGKSVKSVKSAEEKSGRVKSVKSGVYETRDEEAALEYYQMMKAGRHNNNSQEVSSDEELTQIRVNESKMEADRVSEGEADLATYNDDDDDDDGTGKRAITKQIEKNRGLTPHRNKDNKNPRVKLRKKFRKATIRRKGAVREHRPEVHRYGGEMSGIRAGVKKSIKLK